MHCFLFPYANSHTLIQKQVKLKYKIEYLLRLTLGKLLTPKFLVNLALKIFVCIRCTYNCLMLNLMS